MVVKEDEIQDEILRAAIALYRKYGPDKVTMDDVAQATGRSRTSLYYYFKNRDEIFVAVMETIVGDVTREIRKAVAGAEGLQGKLQAFCASKIKTSLDWQQVFHAMWASVGAEELTRHHKAKETLHKKLVYQEGIILHEILAAAAREQQIRPIDAEEQDLLVFIISSGIRGLRREIYELGDVHDMKAAVGVLAGMVVKWLEK